MLEYFVELGGLVRKKNNSSYLSLAAINYAGCVCIQFFP